MHEPYRRRLPHIMPPGEILFITYRIQGTIPHHILLELQDEHKRFLARVAGRIPEEDGVERKGQGEAYYFRAIDKFLDAASEGISWLADNNVAAIVKESIHFRDERHFDLHPIVLCQTTFTY